MDEIKTKIDVVLEFIQEKRMTTPKEVSREFKIDPDELDKYLQLLRNSGLIKIQYSLFNTRIFAEEPNPIRLADEFKSAVSNEYQGDSAAVFDKDEEVTDKNMKIIALKSMLVE